MICGRAETVENGVLELKLRKEKFDVEYRLLVFLEASQTYNHSSWALPLSSHNSTAGGNVRRAAFYRTGGLRGAV